MRQRQATSESTFRLMQNYPNPFNPRTIIQYSITEDGFVTLKVFDPLGKEVATLVNEEKKSGDYIAKWEATRFPTGVYFCQLKAGHFVQMIKLLLLK